MIKELLIGFLIILLLIGIGIFLFKPTYPDQVLHYQSLSVNIDSEELKESLLTKYPEIKGKNYLELLDWISLKLHYPRDNDLVDQQVWDTKMRYEGRPENLINILESRYKIRILYPEENKSYEKALGRCGEFSIIYLSCLKANDYEARFVMGWWEKGDHVWIEVKVNNSWLTIDPTDSCSWREENSRKWDDCPHISFSRKLWGSRAWINVYRIRKEAIENVTGEYNES